MNQPRMNALDRQDIRYTVGEVVSAGRLPNSVTFLDRLFKHIEETPTSQLATYKDIGYFLNVRFHGLKQIFQLTRTYPQYLEKMKSDPERKIAKEIVDNCLDEIGPTEGLESVLEAYFLETGERYLIPRGLRAIQDRLAHVQVMAQRANHPVAYRGPSSNVVLSHASVSRDFIDFALEQSKSQFPIMICGGEEIRALISDGHYKQAIEILYNYLDQPDSIFDDTDPLVFFDAISSKDQNSDSNNLETVSRKSIDFIDEFTSGRLKDKFNNGFLSREFLSDDPHFRAKFKFLRESNVELFSSKAIPKLYFEIFNETMFSRAVNVPVSFFSDTNRNLMMLDDGLSLIRLA